MSIKLESDAILLSPVGGILSVRLSLFCPK